MRTSPTCCPGLVDGTVRVDERTQEFIESDLRCQAELARYRKLLRTLEQLRTRYFEPSPGLLAATLTALAEEGERRVVHSIITGRRLAYAGRRDRWRRRRRCRRHRRPRSPRSRRASLRTGDRSPEDLGESELKQRRIPVR